MKQELVGNALCALVLLALLLAACAPQYEGATAQPTLTPTSTPAASPTLTPTPILTPIPFSSEHITITQVVDLVTNTDVITPALPIWSPDGSRIFYERANGIQVRVSEKFGKGLFDLWEAFADGRPPRKVSENLEGCAWSRDGKQLVCRAFTSGKENEIYILNADGSGKRKLNTGDWADQIAFLPDGSIVFSKDGRLTIMDTSGKVLRQVPNIRLATRENRGGFLVSPDGSRVAFWESFDHSVPREERFKLWVARMDGSGQRLVTGNFNVGVRSASWSPDSKRIAYTVAGAVGEIWVVDGDGANAKLLARKELERFADAYWSPDGRVIAMGALPTGTSPKPNAWLVNSDGSGLRQLLRGYGGAPSPDWSKILLGSEGKLRMAFMAH